MEKDGRSTCFRRRRASRAGSFALSQWPLSNGPTLAPHSPAGRRLPTHRAVLLRNPHGQNREKDWCSARSRRRPASWLGSFASSQPCLSNALTCVSFRPRKRPPRSVLISPSRPSIPFPRSPSKIPPPRAIPASPRVVAGLIRFVATSSFQRTHPRPVSTAQTSAAPPNVRFGHCRFSSSRKKKKWRKNAWHFPPYASLPMSLPYESPYASYASYASYESA